MKRLECWKLIVALVLACPALTRADLIAHWPLDDFGEDVVGDYGGFESGDVTFGVPGANANTGSATRFTDGVIDVPFAPELNPEEFTITVWARPAGGSGHRSVITSRYDGHVFGGGNLDGYIIYNTPSDQWEFWTGDGENIVDFWDVLQGPPVIQDEWQHLAITYDASTNTKTLYVNGLFEASTGNQLYTPVTTEERSLHIGGGGDMGDQFRWVGDIDDLGLWDEVLSEEEIVNVMENGVDSPRSEVITFKRGDTDSDGQLNITDAVFILKYQFSGGQPPACFKTADVDGDGNVNITDPVYVLQFLFSGGPEPAPPFSECGSDGIMNALPCEVFPPCL